MHGRKHKHLVDSKGKSAKYSLRIISPHLYIIFAMNTMTLFKFYPGIILHKYNAIFWIFLMSSILAYLFSIGYTPRLIQFINPLSITINFN